MLHINNKELARAREQAKELTLEEEKRVVEFINKLLSGSSTEEPLQDMDLLQNFIFNYEKYQHYRHYTTGLFCTDKPDKITDNEKLLFQLSF